MIPREILKKIRQIEIRTRAFSAAAACLLLFAASGCSTPAHPLHVSPVATSFNWGAGCGEYLLVKLRLEDTDDLWFAVDTGCPITVISKSLESKLGRPGGHQKIDFFWFDNGKSKATKYSWPKMFLGNTRLQSGEFVVVSDMMNRMANGPNGQPLAGILGMDCLQHYCVQLDFDTRAIRFLESGTLDAGALGKSFRISYISSEAPFRFRSATPRYRFPLWLMRGSPSARVNVLGADEWCLVDTADRADGSLGRRPLQRVSKLQHSPPATGTMTNGSLVIFGFALPQLSLSGYDYTNIVVYSRNRSDQNALGLRLLARNLVTFDFPERTMYLKQRRIGPPTLLTEEERDSLQRFIKEEKENGGLPGLTKDMKGTLIAETSLETGTFSFRSSEKQNANSPVKYYQFQRIDDSWALRRAWLSDANGRVLKEYMHP